MGLSCGDGCAIHILPVGRAAIALGSFPKTENVMNIR
jgi:hypothetical protein